MQHESAKVLDRLESKLGNISDYRAAKELGVSRQAVSNWRRGTHYMSDEIAIKVAQLLGESPEALMAQIAADRAKTEDARKRWVALARRLQRSAAAAMLPAIFLTHGFNIPPAHAESPIKTSAINDLRHMYYANCVEWRLQGGPVADSRVFGPESRRVNAPERDCPADVRPHSR